MVEWEREISPGLRALAQYQLLETTNNTFIDILLQQLGVVTDQRLEQHRSSNRVANAVDDSGIDPVFLPPKIIFALPVVVEKPLNGPPAQLDHVGNLGELHRAGKMLV